MYSRDLSEKIKSVKRIKAKRGEFQSPYAIYGYIKNLQNKHQLIVDPEAAAVVKRIYQLRAEGVQINKIAVMLNQEAALSSEAYKQVKGITKRDWSTLNAPKFGMTQP